MRFIDHLTDHSLRSEIGSTFCISFCTFLHL